MIYIMQSKSSSRESRFISTFLCSRVFPFAALRFMLKDNFCVGMMEYFPCEELIIWNVSRILWNNNIPFLDVFITRVNNKAYDKYLCA